MPTNKDRMVTYLTIEERERVRRCIDRIHEAQTMLARQSHLPPPPKMSESAFVMMCVWNWIERHGDGFVYPEKEDDALGMVAEANSPHKSAAGTKPAKRRDNSVSKARVAARADAISA